MRLIINGKKVNLIPVSRLTGHQFVAIMVKANVTDLKEYIALFAEISIDTLMDAKIDTASLQGLHASIFDIDIEKSIKSPPNTLKYKDIHIIKEMSLDTFGKRYMFELYYDKFRFKKLNIYELSVYCIACAICLEYDTTKIEKIFSELMDMRWTEIIPGAFFLTKRSWKGKRNSTLMWIIFMWGLKVQRVRLGFRLSTLSIIKKNSQLTHLLE